MPRATILAALLAAGTLSGLIVPSLEAEKTASSARKHLNPEAGTIWGAVAARCGPVANEKLPPYPWPLKPFNRQHPVRGYFGDPRTVFSGTGENAMSFHNGVDISAYRGNHVFPVASGVVVKVTPDRIVIASAFDRRFQYIHIKPLVSIGQRVVVSKTVIGLVDPVYHHVHLSEIRGICVVNPLMPGHLTPFHDARTPTIKSIFFENVADERLSPLALTGEVRVIADAYDTPAIPSAPPWNSLPVSPVLIVWRLTTLGGKLLASSVAADYRYSIPPNRDFCEVYAPGTSQNFAAEIGRFEWAKPGVYLYDLTPKLFNTTTFPSGRYRFMVSAENTTGNIGSKTVTVEIDQRPGPAVLRPALDSRCSTREAER